MRLRLRPQKGASPQPRRAYSTYDVPQDKWISIPVPPIIEESLFQAAALQLDENRKHARQRRRGASYLLQGLVTCTQCGYAFYGKPVSRKAAHGKTKRYAYYRCIGSDAYRFGGERQCSNKQLRTDFLEEAVWREVSQLLANPKRLAEEYRRRLDSLRNKPHDQSTGLLSAQQAKLRRSISRLIDSYTEGLINKDEFQPRIKRLKKRLELLETQLRDLAHETKLEQDLRVVIGRLEAFASHVLDRLETANWHTKRELIRTLVKRIEVDEQKVNVVFRIELLPLGGPIAPPSAGPQTTPLVGLKNNLQDCRERDLADLG